MGIEPQVYKIARQECYHYITQAWYHHYTMHHASKYDKIQGEAREVLVRELKKLVHQTQIFRKFTGEQAAACKASFIVAQSIKKHTRPFCDGEFIVLCYKYGQHFSGRKDGEAFRVGTTFTFNNFMQDWLYLEMCLTCCKKNC